MQSETFQLLIDGLPYRVTAKPFEFNEGIRYTVNYNGSLDFFLPRIRAPNCTAP